MSSPEQITITTAYLREQLEEMYRSGYAHGYENGRIAEMAGRAWDKRISWEREQAAATADGREKDA